jgi:peptidoglycan/xylan/chitin deacetylase (PgdA/CDA1 family)
MQFLYPEGRKKALTFSYDDGTVNDRRLVSIFNQYGLKATFHLNSRKLDDDGYITKNEVATLYRNHEVACHGATHAYFEQLTPEQLVNEVWGDRLALEELVGYPVRGMSYPFGEYSEQTVRALKALGIEYSRTVESHCGFRVPCDFLRWGPSWHHNDAFAKADDFLNLPEFIKMPLFYVWGHSFEFERQNTWEKMEHFCEKLAGHDDVWYATNLEIKRYLCAIRAVVFNAAETMAQNPSAVPVWLETGGRIVRIDPGETVDLKQKP